MTTTKALVKALVKAKSKVKVAPKAKAKKKIWFKVLVGDQASSGGEFTYSLPTETSPRQWTPGKWHGIPKKSKLKICSVGFHITMNPAVWWKRNATAYVAEYEGETTQPQEKTKIAVRKIRLLRPAAKAELAKHGIYLGGIHTHRDEETSVWAYGEAQVTIKTDCEYECIHAYAADRSVIIRHTPGSTELYDSATLVDLNYQKSAKPKIMHATSWRPVGP